MNNVVRLVTRDGKDMGFFPRAAVEELGHNPCDIAEALARDPDGLKLRDEVHARYDTEPLQRELDAISASKNTSSEALAFEQLRMGNDEEDN